jgi:exodeoxyribonuclease VII large subunit
MADLRAELGLLCRRGGRAALGELRARRHALERAGTRLGDPRRMLDERRQRLDEAVERARRQLARQTAAARASLRALETRLGHAHPHRRIVEQRGELARLRHRLEVAVQRHIERRKSAVEAAHAKLGALSPLAVLERGFSLTLRPDGHVLTRADEVAPGDPIRVRLREGEIAATVDDTEKKK